MTSLFSSSSLKSLKSFSLNRTLYCFDFDGTLAKIVRSPNDAKMSPRTSQLLRKLSREAPVAVVSGRSVSDLRGRLSFRPPFMIGNHGIEGADTDASVLKRALKICKSWKKQLEGLRYRAALEDKAYSLSLHYRKSECKTTARQSIALAVEQLTPKPHIIQGKSVVNLLPPGAPHKGNAVLNLLKISSMKHCIYIGDDETDEDVFALSEGSNRLFSIRVGKRHSSMAAYYIDRQESINRALELFVSNCKRKPGTPL